MLLSIIVWLSFWRPKTGTFGLFKGQLRHRVRAAPTGCGAIVATLETHRYLPESLYLLLSPCLVSTSSRCRAHHVVHSDPTAPKYSLSEGRGVVGARERLAICRVDRVAIGMPLKNDKIIYELKYQSNVKTIKETAAYTLVPCPRYSSETHVKACADSCVVAWGGVVE